MHNAAHEEELQVPVAQAGRKRQRSGSNTMSDFGGIEGRVSERAAEPTLGKLGHQASMLFPRLRRSLILRNSEVQEIEKFDGDIICVSKETLFLEKLPLKAPYFNQETCPGCGSIECECELESDSEEEEEEEPPGWRKRCVDIIRAKTDVVRHYSGIVVNDHIFQLFILALILINALIVGLATFDFVQDSPEISNAFRIVDTAFLIIFTIELIMQFMYHGYNLFLDGWLLFDFFIVTMGWAFESISVLRAMRLRSFKIFRIFRLTSRIRALRRLVEAILEVLPKIGAILILFSLIMYIFAVMCTELFGDIDFTGRFSEPGLDQYDYFSRLDYSFFTLFAMVTLDWVKVTRAVMEVYPWASMIFSTFVTFSSYVLYNLIIAVVCDAVKMVQDQADISMVENFVKEKIESRHRIINLRQKLDKMSKQQMDLLLYIQLILEQMDDIDDASKEHYETTLLHLGETTHNAKEALRLAISRLDNIVYGSVKKEMPQQRETVKQATPAPPFQLPAQIEEKSAPKGERRHRRVSFVSSVPPKEIQQHPQPRTISLDLSGGDL